VSRSVEEWIGKTPDTPVPPRVKLRIFERDKGRCHISGRLIRAGETWDAEHVIALCNGGENRESNLAPALAALHKGKTAKDVAEKSMVNRVRAKHLGIKSPRQKIANRGFPKRPPQRTASRPIERQT